MRKDPENDLLILSISHIQIVCYKQVRIEEGQKFLSMGVVCGGRNVVSHEEIADLRDSQLFTEKDCLDLLSLLSHLFKRLDESKKK